jgi:hypothetical protein
MPMKFLKHALHVVVIRNQCVKKKSKLLVGVYEDVEGTDAVEERQKGNASSDLANDITNLLTNLFLVLKLFF